MSKSELFSREEILGGFTPTRRASTLLHLVESRTAYLKAHSALSTDLLATERGSEEQDLAFFEAFALGRQPPLRPTLADLER